MGSMQATEMAELMPMKDAIRWHLRSNHFPPVPATMVEPCIQAIDAINKLDYDRLIALPDGVGYKGLTVAPAYAIAKSHHLEPWIDEQEEY
jgi:hypothetical protein